MTTKSLNEQVIFITGASNEVGKNFVHRVVKLGAKVFMVDQHEDELQKIQDEMRLEAFETAYVVADIAEMTQMQFAVDECLKTFGRIDTFINNSAPPQRKEILEETGLKSEFDYYFWGMVNGSKAALEAMGTEGGKLINISYPFKKFHSASFEAVKGFTESLREELRLKSAPIKVTLLAPPKEEGIPEVIQAGLYADALLLACEKSYKTLLVGTTSRFTGILDGLLGRKYSTKQKQVKKGAAILSVSYALFRKFRNS